MATIKKGDEVLVFSGSAKGEKGKVIRVIQKKERLVIEGVNMRVRHRRPRKQGEKGQTLKVPAPVHISNVRHVNPAVKKVSTEAKKK